MRHLTLLLLFPLLASAQISVPTYELDHRIAISIDRLTDPEARPAFTPDFILADVDLNPADPRRFYNFSGDLSGRYIEVMSLLSEQQQMDAGLSDLVAKVIAQQKEDGRFGDPTLRYTADEIGGEHMALLWGNGRLLVGLMTYYEQTGDEATLTSAKKLGDFFIGLAAQSRSPEIAERLEGFGAKGIICFTQYIEGLVMLARSTNDDRYVQAAKDAYTALPDRGEVHTHGYLTTLRGVLMLHELTGDDRHLQYVKTTFDDLLASDDYTRHGAVYEYFGGHGNRDEGCSSADFVRLAFHLAELTKEAKYFDIAEYALYNALYYNQYPNGDFGNHQFTEKGMTTVSPQRAWWCCTMHGLRALLDVRDNYLLKTNEDGTTELRLLTTHTYKGEGKAYSITCNNGRSPEEIEYTFNFTEWDGSDLRLRTPGGSTGTFEVLRPFEGMRVVVYDYPGPVFHAEDGTVTKFPEHPTAGYLTYGPYLLGIKAEDFTAEPNWFNQISWRKLQPGDQPFILQADYRHGGFPGLNSVNITPIMYQTYANHPFLLVTANFTDKIEPKVAD